MGVADDIRANSQSEIGLSGVDGVRGEGYLLMILVSCDVSLTPFYSTDLDPENSSLLSLSLVAQQPPLVGVVLCAEFFCCSLLVMIFVW